VRYSNHNFILAGWLIQVTTGEQFADYLAQTERCSGHQQVIVQFLT